MNQDVHMCLKHVTVIIFTEKAQLLGGFYSCEEKHSHPCSWQECLKHSLTHTDFLGRLILCLLGNAETLWMSRNWRKFGHLRWSNQVLLEKGCMHSPAGFPKLHPSSIGLGAQKFMDFRNISRPVYFWKSCHICKWMRAKWRSQSGAPSSFPGEKLSTWS